MVHGWVSITICICNSFLSEDDIYLSPDVNYMQESVMMLKDLVDISIVMLRFCSFGVT